MGPVTTSSQVTNSQKVREHDAKSDANDVVLTSQPIGTRLNIILAAQALLIILYHMLRSALTFNKPSTSTVSNYFYKRTIMSAPNLPSTMTGPPVSSLVPPGMCQFNDSFQSVPLLNKFPISETSYVLRFGLPDSEKPLNLSTCACILAKADLLNRDSQEKECVIRPYTPISTNADKGFFDLLVKDYGENGRMSTYLTEQLEIGDSVDFKHIPFNVKIQAPFPQHTIGMIVGGTGITPMIQALHAILASEKENKDTKVTMLYGSRVASDILGQELLETWSKDNDNLDVIHVLSHEPNDSDWKGPRGYVTKELVEKYMPPPSDKNAIIFVCGPPVMYDALCGPRDDKELSGLLAEMGYTADQVYKF